MRLFILFLFALHSLAASAQTVSMWHVKKHPLPNCLAVCSPAQIGDPVPAGYELMTEAEFAAWQAGERAAGWAPVSAVAAVPEAVTPLQMRRALSAAGLRSAVEAAVAASSQDAQDAWTFATEVRRDDPILAGLAAALGKTSAEIDDLFRLAATF